MKTDWKLLAHFINFLRQDFSLQYIASRCEIEMDFLIQTAMLAIKSFR